VEDIPIGLTEESMIWDSYLKYVTFPEPAGNLEQAGQVLALVRELGDNYPTYHAFLQRELDEIGGWPDRQAHMSAEGFLAEWALIQDIAKAEHFLRNCRAFRHEGRRLDAPLDTSVPLADPSGALRLVSVE